MGPNLAELFADDTSGAQARLQDIFDRHGEALIAALEESLHCFQITQRVEDYPANHWAPKAKQLLAQLEAEAQP